MNKQEFIDSLRRNLTSISDYNFVNDTIAYYENYIETQIRMGKTEEEVMQQLGDPRLIAKSIKATCESEDADEQSAYHDYEQDKYSGSHSLLDSVFRFNDKLIRMPSWLIKTLVIIVLLLVLFVVVTVLRWLSPFIFMGLIAYLFYRTFIGKY